MTRRPEIWEDAFLVALARTDGQIRVAAELAGIHRAQVYRRMKRSAEFRKSVGSVIDRLRDDRSTRAQTHSIS